MRWLNVQRKVRFVRIREGLRYFIATFAVLIFSLAAYERMTYERARTSINNSKIESSLIAREAAQLSFALTAAFVLDIALLGLAWWSLNRWILRPLNEMREQLRAVASGQRHSLIAIRRPIEISEAAADAELMRRDLVREIDLARSAQQGLEQNAPIVESMRKALSATNQISPPEGMDIFGVTQPARGVIAGDWWDIIPTPEGRAIAVVDVAGHGTESGILGLQIKAVMTAGFAAGIAPEIIFNRISKDLRHIEALHATAFVVIIPNDQYKPIEWVNAGHPSSLFIDKHGLSHELMATGPMLAGFEAHWDRQELPLDDGERLIIMSDGLVETRDANNAEYGLNSVIETLGRCNPKIDSETLVSNLLTNARGVSVTWDVDDVTLVALTRRLDS